MTLIDLPVRPVVRFQPVAATEATVGISEADAVNEQPESVVEIESVTGVAVQIATVFESDEQTVEASPAEPEEARPAEHGNESAGQAAEQPSVKDDASDATSTENTANKADGKSRRKRNRGRRRRKSGGS